MQQCLRVLGAVVHEFDHVINLLKSKSSIVATEMLIILNGEALVSR